MKKTFTISSGMALFVISLSSHAVTEVKSMDGRTVSGYVSVTGANTLDDLTAALSKKAVKSGASEFYITSAGGRNKLHGTAVLLKSP